MERQFEVLIKIIPFRSWKREMEVDEEYETLDDYLGNGNQDHLLPRSWVGERLLSLFMILSRKLGQYVVYRLQLKDCCLKKNQNAPRPSEHPPVRGKSCCSFSHSAYWLPTRKNDFTRWPIHSWSAEQGKRKEKKVCQRSPPPPPRCPYRGK